MTSRKLISIGLVFLIVSVAVGLLGTAWGVSRSFGSMVTNESAGIGAVGGGIFEALIFSIVGIIGFLAGVALLIVGLVRSRRLK
ncbi:MAG: MotA/TolQ/ExbB proton channel family protein [Pyrinomonadaceae bacterium]